MILKGDTDRYGAVLIGLHWISAVAVLMLLGLGFAAANSGDPAQKAALLRLHVPLGLLALALTAVRIVWWAFDTRPGELVGQPRWQAATARAVHVLLYMLLVALGVSGVGLMALSGASKVLFLGAPGPLPDFASLGPLIVHRPGAFALATLLCLHIGAAPHHQTIRRDRLFARIGLGAFVRGLR